MLQEELWKIRRQLAKEKTVILKLPNRFGFKDHDLHDFDGCLSFFDWSLRDRMVKIDLTTCQTANYQAIALLVPYAWKLKSQGCTVSFIENESSQMGVSAMWRRMGARGLFSVLPDEAQQFNGTNFKPLFAVRSAKDFKTVIEAADSYTDGFNVEYENTLRYVLGELLYNTMEHGPSYARINQRDTRIPSIAQFTWYRNRNEIHFIIADLGIGIKKHIELAYPGQESHEEAIKLALKAKTSGTFGRSDPYSNKNNAGMGLYISSNIIRRLNADMHIVSGNGLTHISSRDITGRTIEFEWPGTFVLVTLRIEENPEFNLHKIMQEFRNAANAEQNSADQKEDEGKFYISMTNFFGRFAEDKEAAIKFRDERIFKALESDKTLVFDFDDVASSPHSFISALLASPIQTLGLVAHKRIKIINASPEIRETIDFVFDDNT